MLRGNAVHKTLERFFKEGYGNAGDAAHYDDLRNSIIGLLNDEWKNRQHIRRNPELEMVYAVIKQQNKKANKELVIQFLHNSYQLSKAKIMNLISSLKQMGRVVEQDGYLMTADNAKFGNIYEVVKFE